MHNTHTHAERERWAATYSSAASKDQLLQKKGAGCARSSSTLMKVCLSLSVHTHLKRTGGIVEMSQESLSISQESDSRVRQQPSVHTDRAKPRGIDRSHFAVQTQPSKTHVRERERERQTEKITSPT